MEAKKFWEWKEIKKKKTIDKVEMATLENKDTKEVAEEMEEVVEQVLLLNGPIASESWFDDEVTPEIFKNELEEKMGDITVWINSPGGDCIAAAQIYNMLKSHKGKVTIKVDGLAASAASVIAMAGDIMYMSPVSMLMIHNPETMAIGNYEELSKAIDMLTAVKDSIINAYELKTHLSRHKISELMDNESWMDCKKAIELKFCDGMLGRDDTEIMENHFRPQIFEKNVLEKNLTNKLKDKYLIKKEEPVGVKVDDIYMRLNTIKKFI